MPLGQQPFTGVSNSALGLVPTHPPGPPQTHAHGLSPSAFLIVEDDQNRSDKLAQLCPHDRVHRVTRGQDAIAALREHSCNLVFLDFDLVDTLKGADVARAIAQLPRHERPAVVVHSRNELGAELIKRILPTAIICPVRDILRDERKSRSGWTHRYEDTIRATATPSRSGRKAKARCSGPQYRGHLRRIPGTSTRHHERRCHESKSSLSLATPSFPGATRTRRRPLAPRALTCYLLLLSTPTHCDTGVDANPAKPQAQSTSADCALTHAESYLGTPYRWGGRMEPSHPGIDCLGLLYLAWGPCTGTGWREYPVDPSKLVASGRLGAPEPGLDGVPRTELNHHRLQTGDVLYFLLAGYKIDDAPLLVQDGTQYWPWHTGLYVGGSEVIHAAPGGDVRQDILSSITFDALFATRFAQPLEEAVDSHATTAPSTE